VVDARFDVAGRFRTWSPLLGDGPRFVAAFEAATAPATLPAPDRELCVAPNQGEVIGETLSISYSISAGMGGVVRNTMSAGAECDKLRSGW
jgi:hypothetical protein